MVSFLNRGKRSGTTAQSDQERLKARLKKGKLHANKGGKVGGRRRRWGRNRGKHKASATKGSTGAYRFRPLQSVRSRIRKKEQGSTGAHYRVTAMEMRCLATLTDATMRATGIVKVTTIAGRRTSIRRCRMKKRRSTEPLLSVAACWLITNTALLCAVSVAPGGSYLNESIQSGVPRRSASLASCPVRNGSVKDSLLRVWNRGRSDERNDSVSTPSDSMSWSLKEFDTASSTDILDVSGNQEWEISESLCMMVLALAIGAAVLASSKRRGRGTMLTNQWTCAVMSCALLMHSVVLWTIRAGRIGFAALVIGGVVMNAQPVDSMDGQEEGGLGMSALAFMTAGGFAGLLRKGWKAATGEKPPVQRGRLSLDGVECSSDSEGEDIYANMSTDDDMYISDAEEDEAGDVVPGVEDDIQSGLVTSNQWWAGDQFKSGFKSKGIVIMSDNVRRFPVGSDMHEQLPFWKRMLMHSPDFIGVVDHGLDVNHADVKGQYCSQKSSGQTLKRAEKWGGSGTSWIVSTGMKGKRGGEFKECLEGGTLLAASAQWKSRTQEHFVDERGWGRYCGAVIKGAKGWKSQVVVIIVHVPTPSSAAWGRQNEVLKQLRVSGKGIEVNPHAQC